jgi:hypothetical protein
MIRCGECPFCFFFACPYSARVVRIHAKISHNLALSSGALSMWSFPFIVRTDRSITRSFTWVRRRSLVFRTYAVNLCSLENLGAPRTPKVEGEGCDGHDDFHHDAIVVLLPPVSSFFVENVNPVLDEFTLEEMVLSHHCLVVDQCLGHG